MSRSNDADHFFQTDQSLAETTRRARKSTNEHGQPIRLKSKILCLASDPIKANAVYVGESVGQVRRMVPDTGESTHIYRGPTAPIGSLAVSPDGTVLFAACWDKTVWSWDTSTRQPRHRCKGHTDFVKAITCIRVHEVQHGAFRHTDILFSGSADTTIIIWDTSTGTKLHTLAGHSRGVLCLAIDPLSIDSAATDSSTEDDDNCIRHIILLSGSSDREILEWHIPTSSFFPSPETNITTTISKTIAPLAPPLLIHETSVNALHFTSTLPPDLWTASADTTAKCLSHPTLADDHPTIPASTTTTTTARFDAKDVHTTLSTSKTTTNHLRTITTHSPSNIVMTAGRDENIHVFDASTAESVCVFEGHFDEVTALAIVTSDETGSDAAGGGDSSTTTQKSLPPIPTRYQDYLISASLDGTIRRWSLAPGNLARWKVKDEAESDDDDDDEEGDNEAEGDEDDADGGGSGGGGSKAGREKAAAMITEEEERELEALMAED